MILTKREIHDLGLVKGAVTVGARDTTYDATVGHIISAGDYVNETSYTLQPRGMVWVISTEEFRLPKDITGLATLRTTWAHGGILALNVGVIDPGWEGPLATAIVNFSKKKFKINKGDTFFRVMFNRHANTEAPYVIQHAHEYNERILKQTSYFSDTFLTMDTLVPEISDEIFKFPRWTVWLGGVAVLLAFVGLIVAVLTALVPIAFSVGAEKHNDRVRIEVLEKRLEELLKR